MTWHLSPGIGQNILSTCGKFARIKNSLIQFIVDHLHASLRQFVDITTLLLERKTFTSAELVTGRTLLDRSMSGLRNYKKAGSFVGKYLDENGSPKLSGWDMSNVWTKVLDDMWDMLMSKKNCLPSGSGLETYR